MKNSEIIAFESPAFLYLCIQFCKMDRLRFLSIGSGSSGNCYYIGTGEYGFHRCRHQHTYDKTLKEKHLNFENIWGILLRDHTDHIKSVGILGEKYHIPVYLTQEMRDRINRNYKITDKLVSCCKYFRKGENIVIKDFTFRAFREPRCLRLRRLLHSL